MDEIIINVLQSQNIDCANIQPTLKYPNKPENQEKYGRQWNIHADNIHSYIDGRYVPSTELLNIRKGYYDLLICLNRVVYSQAFNKYFVIFNLKSINYRKQFTDALNDEYENFFIDTNFFNNKEVKDNQEIKNNKEKVKDNQEIKDEEAENKQEKVFSTDICVICLDNTPNHTLKPCNHACLCSECIGEFKKNKSICPMCRITIVEIVNIL